MRPKVFFLYRELLLKRGSGQHLTAGERSKMMKIRNRSLPLFFAYFSFSLLSRFTVDLPSLTSNLSSCLLLLTKKHLFWCFVDPFTCWKGNVKKRKHIWHNNTEDKQQLNSSCVGLAMMLQYPLVVHLWTPRHPAIWNWFTSAVGYCVLHDIRLCWTELVATPPTNHIICKCVAPSQPCCRPVQLGNHNESKSSQI